MKPIAIIIVLVIYWVPTIVAALRQNQVASVAVINGFLGWTLVGWVVALAMSVREKPNTIVLR